MTRQIWKTQAGVLRERSTSARPPSCSFPRYASRRRGGQAQRRRDAVGPSQNKAPVFALGVIGFDFGTEARRDTFKQQMHPVAGPGGSFIPANPYDARQLVPYLRDNPSEAKSLIWTLNLELTPIYAIKPYGPYGEAVYESLIELLDAQNKLPTDRDYVTRASIPGLLTGDTVKLFSGQTVPALAVDARRGIHGWAVNQLIEAALRAVEPQPPPAAAQLIGAVTNFLNRMYYDYRNLGLTSASSALNFTVTNLFQTLVSFAATLAQGKQVGAIQVLKSPYCRIDSDCWDVQIKFFNPNNVFTAWTVIRYAVDVSDKLPVTLGDVVEWEAASLFRVNGPGASRIRVTALRRLISSGRNGCPRIRYRPPLNGLA